MFLDGDEEEVLAEAGFFSCEAFEFEFVELVHAEDALHIFAVAAGFLAEAGGVTEVTDGHVGLGEDFVGVHGAEDVFGATLEPEFVTFDFVAVFAGLEAIHGVVRFGFNHEGWEDGREGFSRKVGEFGVFDDLLDLGFVGESVDGELDDCHLEFDEVAHEVGEAGAGDFCGALFVDPAAGLADFPMVLRLKVELGGFADDFADDVFVFGFADGNVIGGGVGDLFEKDGVVGVDVAEFFLELCKFVFDATAGGDGFGRRFFRRLHTAREIVALLAEFVDGGGKTAAAFVET